MSEAPRNEPFLEFNPHWFRRAVHAMGAAFVLFYLLPPAHPVAGPVRRYLPGLAFAAFAGLEAVRMAGGIKTEHFFGLREYERSRVSGYVYFGAGTVLLLYLFPQSIAVPSIVGGAIGDPIVGEIRDRGWNWTSLAVGALLGAFLYALAGWHPGLALGAGVLMGAAERTRIWLLDDDFVMPVVPALALLLLVLGGWVQAPPDLIVPLGAWGS